MKMQHQPRADNQCAMASGVAISDHVALDHLVEKIERGYKRQELPDESVFVERGDLVGGGQRMTPVVTLKDSFNGVAHIVKDEGDFILVIGSYVGGFVKTHRWFKEAVLALFAHAARIEVVLK